MRFRKSKNFGPFRVTLSKSGISTSFGVKGLRVTKTANGRTRMTASIPGTGISYVTESKRAPAARSQQMRAAAAIPQQTPETPPQVRRSKRAPLIGIIALVLCTLFSSCAKKADNDDGEGWKRLNEADVKGKVTTVEITPTPTEPTRSATVDEVAEDAAALALVDLAEPDPELNTYVLNTSSMKFHKPGCKSVSKIKESNMEIIEATREDLIAAGYEPCGNCHP